MTKNIILLSFLSLIISCIQFDLSAQSFGILIDSRDGKKYKTVKVDKFEIMAENLAYNKFGICYDLEPLFCEDYGRLYTFQQIKSSQNSICPSGWHIPTSSEWKYIFTKLGKINTYKTGISVKLNTNPLNLILSGYGNGEEPGYVKFLSLQKYGFFASSTKTYVEGAFDEYETWLVVSVQELGDQENVEKSTNYFSYDLRGTGTDNFISCRCIKDY